MKTSLLIALVLTILIGGCATTGLNNAFHTDGFPKQQYYVGGGFQVEYNTHETGGTIIFADSISRKIIITKTLTPMDEFEFSIDPTAGDCADTFTTIGVDPANIRLSLYFIPNEKTASEGTK